MGDSANCLNQNFQDFLLVVAWAAARCASRRYGEMTSQSGTDSVWGIITIVHLETAAFLAYFVGWAVCFFDIRTPI